VSTVVITGASAGVGAAAARRLASLGHEVVVVGRSPEKTKRVAAEIGAPGLTADFSRLADVRRLAAELLERCRRIDVLANNAGVTVPRRTISEDGHELTFQTNHLAPFLLTRLLRERLEATPGARVLNTASVGNQGGRVDLDDLSYERRRYFQLRAYMTSKLLNVLFTAELARRAPKLLTVSFHPGNIASDFGRDSPLYGVLYRTPLKRVFLVPPETGGEALVQLATRDDLAQYNGGYFDRFTPNGRTSRQARDPELARGLWERSEALLS
jgi:NAD(P)-dependent dehydrogenase (short-subunit alcohol dehydrogenase family)